MAESYFVGIKLMGTAAEQLDVFQREIATRAKSSYGFGGIVSHGRSPFHITLVPPFEASEKLIEEVVQTVASRYVTLHTTLTRPGIFTGDRSIASRCGEGLQTLLKIRTELGRSLRTGLPEAVLHASVVRNIEPPESFPLVCAAADEIVLENLTRWPLEAPCYGLTVFKKQEPGGVWVDRSYHAFTATENPQ